MYIKTNQELQQNGVAVLPNIISAEWINTLQIGCDKAIANPGPFAMQYSKNPTKQYFADSFMWNRIDEFKNFIFGSNIGKIVSKIMGGDDVYLFFDHLLVKEPYSNTSTPWHQDLPYWPLKGGKILSTWIPLDDIDSSSGRMEYIINHDANKILYKPKNFGGDNRYANKPYPEIPDIDANKELYDIVAYDTKQGDLLVFDDKIIHGSSGNTSNKRRRALSLRWVNQDVTFSGDEITIKIPSNHGLQAGDLMSKSHQFPLVWPQNNGETNNE